MYDYSPRKRTVGTVKDWNGQTRYTVFVDGQEDMHASYRDTPDEVIDKDLFPPYAWPGGYVIAYYPPDAGIVLCAACAAAEYREDPEEGSMIQGEIAEESQHSTGLMCDGCNEWIIAPHCVDCGDDLDEIAAKTRTIFQDDTGEFFLCSHCLAEAVTRKRAHKTGKRQYRVTDEWYRGQFTQEGAH